MAFGASKEAMEIKKLYKCLAKDFLIYDFVKQKTTSSEDAKYLYSELYRPTNRLKKLFLKKTKDLDFVYPNRCKSCKYIGITPRGFEKLGLKKQKLRYKKVKKKLKKRVPWMEAMIAKNSFNALTKGDGKDFLKVFFSVSSKYKQKVLDKHLPVGFLTRLANQKKFYHFVMTVVMDGKYKNLTKSLLRVNPYRAKMDYNSAFYLGLNAVKLKQDKRAVLYFKRAIKQTKRKANKDKAKFWVYLVSKDKKYLKKAAKSTDLNFYSYYAKELLGKLDFNIITPKPSEKSLKGFNVNDPFLWAKTLNDFKHTKLKNEFADMFFTKQTLAHYAFFKERISSYKNYYFITPYDELLSDKNSKRKILINSLARQESRFVPASVSTSYALGFMQFMPFLIKDTAKDNHILNFKYFDIFEPKNAIKFANIHLDYLNEYLHSPLFIAYAYNGGIGFTRSLFNKRGLFKKGKYEPFLSMELVHYSESRKYGKKVLVNYAIYSKFYGKQMKLQTLLNDVTNLSKSKAYKK